VKKRNFNLGGPLDLDAPKGTYLVDAFARDLGRPDALSEIRAAVDQAAALAQHLGEAGRDLPRDRRLAKALIDDSRKFLRRARELRTSIRAMGPCDRNVTSAAVVPFDSKHGLPPAEVFIELLKLARELEKTISQAQEFAEQWQVRRPRSSADWQSRTFLKSLIDFWTRAFGRPPSRSAFGPFPRFIAAAWQDVRFPIPKKHEADVAGWLGEKTVKLIPPVRKPRSKQ
jgi:hypothetical protein